jgi:hypothetical protein
MTYPFCYATRDYPHLKGPKRGKRPYKRRNGGDRGLAPTPMVLAGMRYRLKFRLHGVMWCEDYRLEDPKMHERPMRKDRKGKRRNQ